MHGQAVSQWCSQDLISGSPVTRAASYGQDSVPQPLTAGISALQAHPFTQMPPMQDRSPCLSVMPTPHPNLPAALSFAFPSILLPAVPPPC